MQKCEACNIRIIGSKERCPLCGRTISGGSVPDVYPNHLPEKKGIFSFIRIWTFVFVAAEVFFLTLQFMIGFDHIWIYWAEASVFLVWLNTFIGAVYKSNIVRNITSQAYIVAAICVASDILSGFRGWSVKWLLPVMFVVLPILIISIGKGLKWNLEGYILYLILMCLLSFVQLIWLIPGLNTFPYPALISIAFCVVITAAVFIFFFHEIRNAGTPRFHI